MHYFVLSFLLVFIYMASTPLVAAPMPYEARAIQNESINKDTDENKNNSTHLKMDPPEAILNCIKTGLADILKKNSVDVLVETPKGASVIFDFYGSDPAHPLSTPEGLLTLLGTELFQAAANCDCETPRELPNPDEYHISVSCQPWPGKEGFPADNPDDVAAQ